MNSLQFLERAQLEIEESSEWYEKQSPGLGSRFIDAVEEKMKFIIQSPELFPIKRGSYREAPLTKFPFSIVFKFRKQENSIVIFSVFHNSRNPKHKFSPKKK